MNTKTICKQKNFHGTVNGRAIQRHFEEIEEDLFSEIFRVKVQPMELKKFKEQTISCMVCGSTKTYICWCKNYSGFRGNCFVCKHNWPES